MKGVNELEKILETEGEIVYRFQSDCMEPGCAIDVSLEKNVISESRYVEIFFWATPARLWDRVRWVWRMMTTGVGFEHEFIVREVDIEDLARTIKGE